MKISMLAKGWGVVALVVVAAAAIQAQGATSKAMVTVVGFVEKPGEYGRR